MMDRPIAFVLASTDHGMMIVNRYDYQMKNPEYGYGVGFSIFNKSAFDRDCVYAGCDLLNMRRKHFGDGVVALDCGANIGVMTVEWSRHMMGWGKVLAFEPQEHVFNALAGNVALNNCFNAHVFNAAVGAVSHHMNIPVLDPTTPSNFGGLELMPRDGAEDVGQPITRHATVSCVSVDSLDLPRVDFIKLDVEGMEVQALAGAVNTISRSKPMLIVEYIKNQHKVDEMLRGLNYRFTMLDGVNYIAIHEGDPAVGRLDGREAA